MLITQLAIRFLNLKLVACTCFGITKMPRIENAEGERLIAGISNNFFELGESVEDCFAKGHILPCLVLLFSSIDIIASLEHGRANRAAFVRWSNKYLLAAAPLPCTAPDLYGSRCSILHTISLESDLWRRGPARQILYAWGNVSSDELEQAARQPESGTCVVHVEDLIKAFRLGLTNYMQEIVNDHGRKQKIFAGAGTWLTQMDQLNVKTFLKARTF